MRSTHLNRRSPFSNIQCIYFLSLSKNYVTTLRICCTCWIFKESIKITINSKFRCCKTTVIWLFNMKIIKKNTIVPSFSASSSFSKEAGINGFASPKTKSSGINSGAAPCNLRDFRTGSSGIASSCFFFFVTRFGLLTSETIYNKRMKKTWNRRNVQFFK